MREEFEWSHALEDRHVEQIKKMFPDLNVVVGRGEEVIQKEARDADIIAGYPVRIPPITQNMPVKWIHSFSAGVDRVLTPEIKANDDIIVSNSSGIHAIPISEHILGLLLSFNKNFPTLNKRQKNHVWKREEPTRELHHKTIVVFGLGAIGNETAKLLKAFNCTVYGVVRTLRKKPEYIDGLFTMETVQDILPTSDYVIICLPGSPEITGSFNTRLFSKMNPRTVIVNIGRGTIINQDDLIEALVNKTIGGALLDVTSPEPLPANSPLWDMENVIITPHCAGSSPNSMDRAIDRLCLNIEAFLKNEKLPNLVDKELGY